MDKRLSILAPTRYPWRFNSPRHSRHDISIRRFLPMNRFSYKLEGFTVFEPWPPKRFDLIHTYNRIPLSTLPFVIGFESHLPRAYTMEHTAYYRWLTGRLLSDKCRKIVAISDYARHLFLRQHQDSPELDALSRKLVVRFPNINIAQPEDAFVPTPGDSIHLVYVGRHFGRKGGAVAVRMAEMAIEQGIPIEIDIVSRLEVGIMSWVDPLRSSFFDSDIAKLHSLPNIRFFTELPNDVLMQHIRQAHFLLLPTFADTFGFGVIESMACFTPVITTRQGALPEFVTDSENGILLDLECDEYGDWTHIKRQDRDQPAYEKLFRDEIERLAEQSLQRLLSTLSNPAGYRAMRCAARATAERCFSATDADTYWDTLYSEAVA